MLAISPSPLHDRIADLEEENRQLLARIAGLEGRDIYESIRDRLDLTNRQAQLLALLVARGIATRDQCLDATHQGPERLHIDDEYGAIGTLIKHLRRALDPHGISIRTLYAHGWRMEDVDRAKVRALIEGENKPARADGGASIFMRHADIRS